MHDAGQAFKAETGVDVLFLKRGVVALAVGIELSKDQIPELDVPVAVAAGSAARAAAAVFLAAVKVNLRARAAGARADFPEVVLPSQTDDMGRVDADLARPDVISLVIL